MLLVLYRDIPRATKKTDESEHDHQHIFLAKGFTVFNIEQTSGLEHLQIQLNARSHRAFEGLEECERVVAATGAVIREGNQASYSPARDVITMPPRSTFARATEWYATAYHELTHWSGAKHRLDRDLSGLYGGTPYAKEELVAELGACFLAARTGIEHLSQSASYIGNWLEALHADKRFIFATARLATQAAAFIYPDSAPAQLTLEPVAISQTFLEAVDKVCHQVPFTSRSKRGLPRSGAKVGSILSQPGER